MRGGGATWEDLHLRGVGGGGGGGGGDSLSVSTCPMSVCVGLPAYVLPVKWTKRM